MYEALCKTCLLNCLSNEQKDEWGSIKIKNFCASKDIIENEKVTQIMGGKNVAIQCI